MIFSLHLWAELFRGRRRRSKWLRVDGRGGGGEGNHLNAPLL
jgi:hypothetical protein